MDLAELLIKIDSTDLVQSEKLLIDYYKAGEGAEDQTKQLGKVTEAVFEQMGKDLQLVKNRSQVFNNFDQNASKIFIVEEALERLLREGVDPNSTAVQQLTQQYEQLKAAAPKANKGIGQTAGLLTNIGYLIQDAPFAIMSGNLAAVANNIPAVTGGFQRLMVSGGGLVGALRLIGTTLLGPTGIILLLGSILPSVILLAQSGVLNFGDDVQETDRKLKKSNVTLEEFIRLTASLGGENIFNPLGIEDTRRELDQLEMIKDSLTEYYDALQLIDRLGATAAVTPYIGTANITPNFGSIYNAPIINEVHTKLAAAEQEVERFEQLYGNLSQFQQEYIDELIDIKKKELDRFEVLSIFNPLLAKQVDLNKELLPVIRNFNLGIDGSKEALEGLVETYDKEIGRIGTSNDLTEQEIRWLKLLTDARDSAKSALEGEQEAAFDVDKRLKELDQTFENIDSKDYLGVFGDFNATDEKMKAIEKTLHDLIENGVLPTENAVVDLIKKWNELNDSAFDVDKRLKELDQTFENIDSKDYLGVFGDFNATDEKMKAIEKTLHDLIENGVLPTEDAVVDLIKKWNELNDSAFDVDKRLKELDQTFENIDSKDYLGVFGDFNATDEKMKAIEKTLHDLIENGVLPTEGAVVDLIKKWNELNDSADKVFPTGSIAQLEQKIGKLVEKMRLLTDPEEIRIMREEILALEMQLDSLTVTTESAEEALTRMTQVGITDVISNAATQMFFFQEETRKVRNELGEMEVQTITLGDQLKDTFQQFFQYLTELYIRLLVIEPLVNATFSALGLSTGSGSVTASAKGNVFSGGEVQPFAKGGVFTNKIVSGPTLFDMGLMGEAGDEGIFPLGRTRSGELGVKAIGSGSSNVTVNVVNQNGSQVDVETKETSSGFNVDVIIKRKVKDMINDGQLDKEMKHNFGMKRHGTRRG
jgi:hypothetical protein